MITSRHSQAVMHPTSLTHNMNTMSWVANILSTDNYITYEQVTESVSIVWVQHNLADRFIKYIFYSLTFGDIWIHFIGLLTYFVFLMNYLRTNVHISELSKKCVYSNPYFFGDLAFMRIIFFHLPPYIRGSNKKNLNETVCLMHMFSRKILTKGLVHTN